MNSQTSIDKQHAMLRFMSNIPRKILSHHGKENMTEFVLHELCHENCFNLNKAAFFIDNPDFNCTKGIAGFSREETFGHPEIWTNDQAFSDHMKSSQFNKKVRGISKHSFKKIVDAHEELAQQIAQDLGFKNHGYCSWPMKHQNDGFLIYEKASTDTYADDFLVNGLTLLGFCPVF